MRACVDMGRAAVVTGDRDEFGDEYQTIRVMTVADAIKLRDELTDVIEQVSRLPCIGGCKCDAALTGWTKYSKQSRASAARGTAIRTEVIWLNRACSTALSQQEIQGRLL